LFASIYSLGLILKPLRYYFFLKKDSLLIFAKSFYIGNLINLFLPFRLGDVTRIFLFNKTNSKKSNALLIIFEKILDLLTMFLLLFFSYSFFINEAYLDLFISFFKYSCLIIFFILALTFFKSFKTYNAILFKALSVILITIFAWSIEGIAVAYFLSRTLAIDYGIGFSFMPLTTLSTLIPSAPGYIGVINFALIKWAEIINVSNSNIGAISFEFYTLMWVVTLIFGLISIKPHWKTVLEFLKESLTKIFKRN